jgi:23S rRNA (cytosine1962-C5)-methyltransferase
MSAVIIKHGKTSRLASSHPWVYAGEIDSLRGDAKDGDTVDIRDTKGRFLGRGLFNSKSQITVRRFTLGHDELDEPFLRARLQSALALRLRSLPQIIGQPAAAFRVVFSEADSLPGIILDRFPNALALQTLTLGMDVRKQTIAKLAAELLCCDTIIERNDAPVRTLEGLKEVSGLLPVTPQSLTAGKLAAGGRCSTEFTLNDVRFSADLLSGQKTGAYLDQRVNYREVAAWSKGRRVLDAFCYQGGFALHCAKAGAKSVEALDISEDAMTAAQQNARLNGVEKLCAFRTANAFDLLKAYQQENRAYELIVLDPPSFTRSKQQLEGAARGYKELNLRALKMLGPGGMLATFCCSHHVDAALFKAIVLDAAADAHKLLRLVRTLTQSPDHPILPAVPETEYLKGFLLEVC